MTYPYSTVILNLFQDPSRLNRQAAQNEKWTLKQVQGDEAGTGVRV